MSTNVFRSTEATSYDRGRGFGTANARQVTRTVTAYRSLFDTAAGTAVDLDSWGRLARTQIECHAPDLADEIRGIADGAGLPVESVSAINARTEILAALGARSAECTTVVGLRTGAAPVAVQCWDWYESLADSWLAWEIIHPDGRVTTTVTEYGIVGKIGVNDRGIGLLFNILHHRADGDGIGFPVHVLARSVLDQADDLNQALSRIAQAPVSASTCLTVVGHRGGESAAVSVELNPATIGYALPDERGILVHTNHFLSAPAALDDTELVGGPDTVIRHDMVRRALADVGELTEERALRALDAHLLGGGATCAHPDPALGAAAQFETLATVRLDLEAGTVSAHPGGPCTHPLIHPESPAYKENPMTTAPLALKRIDNMDILSHDVDRLARFYTETLGLSYFLPYERDENWAAIDMGNVTLYIFESTVGEHEPRRTAINAENAPGMDSFAFEVDDLDAAEAALEGKVEWVDERIEWKHPNGTWYRYRPFFDPDGNMLYVTEPHVAPEA
ncbi:C45 family autoproteolytic acyltransferase/hydrolase [Gordonia sp. CPCC 205515]|uniref:C45 family autoproteolytic acyltransferase/hydolase n=1 Tax=Gordonia sp. CPCC 205515 TaxID=3140791 RepID=UPI003AF3E911